MRSVQGKAVGAAAVAAALAVAAVGLFSGGAGDRAPDRAAPVALIGGVPLQQARCRQWLRGSEAQRGAIVATLAQVVGGPSGDARGSTLTRARAFGLFSRACSSPIARHFLLYELYTRAAAFGSLRSPQA